MPYVSNRSLILTVFALAIFPHGVMGLLFQFLYPDYYENRTGCLIDKEFYIYFPRKLHRVVCLVACQTCFVWLLL